MKQIKTLVLVALVYMSSLVTVNAQAAKTAHVDVSEIVSKMPAMLDAQKQMEKLRMTYETEFKTMVEEFQNKVKKYEQESVTIKDAAIIDTRSKEIQEMEKRIMDYRDNAQRELQQKESDIRNPIWNKVKASIQKVGKEKGYQYVIDSEGLLLADGPNLTAEVKKDLGF